jgi:hypothetical protein
MTLVHAMVANNIVEKCISAWAALVVLAPKANQEATPHGTNTSGACAYPTAASTKSPAPTHTQCHGAMMQWMRSLLA